MYKLSISNCRNWKNIWKNQTTIIYTMTLRLCVVSESNNICPCSLVPYVYFSNDKQPANTNNHKKRTHAFVRTPGISAVGITCTRFQIIAVLLSFWTLTYRRLFIYRSFPMKSDETNLCAATLAIGTMAGQAFSKLTGHIY